MKSNLFSKIDLMRSDTFSKDMHVLVEIDPEILTKLPKYAYDSMAAPTTQETDLVHEKASKDLGVPVSKLKHAIVLSEYFMRTFTSDGEAEKDTCEDIVSDIQTLIEFDESRKEKLVEYFENTKKLGKEKADYLVRRRLHAQSSLPNLKSISSVVDYRIVFDKDIKVGQNIDDYNPKCLGAIPVCIIEVGLSGGDIKEISFQIDEKAIRLIIDELLALEKQINIAQHHFELEE